MFGLFVFQFATKGVQKKHFGLLLKKGIYPYEHASNYEVFNETFLPPKEAFYSKLSMSGITNREYKHAKRVWRKFKCKTFRDYTTLYCVCDTLLLADVMEGFRWVVLHYDMDILL